ncbi:MAG: cytochrome b/b6 domain-containing protein [Deltaproteobacteria bacterium]|nr:cytochrome b/b6 domain-containing protein [Deltaproteobacteria bacterium]
MAEECYYKHDGVERFTHWTHTVDTIFLILSGIQIHYPGFSVFGSMITARFVHLVSGYLFIFLGIFHVYFFFALGKNWVAMPRLSDINEIGRVVKYYLFLSRIKPDYAKYNVLQKFSYAGLFAVSFLQTVLGFALYWPVVLAPVLALFGGAVAVRIWHTTVMWIFLSFTAVHVYLVLTEDLRLVKAMVDGYYFHEVADKGGSQAT